MGRKLKIIEKKLGKEHAWGMFIPAKNVIEIDPRQGSRRYLNTLIHELLHYLYPEDSETKVTENAYILTRHIWNKNYRRVSK